MLFGFPITLWALGLFCLIWTTNPRCAVHHSPGCRHNRKASK
jgi:hypothetical protein